MKKFFAAILSVVLGVGFMTSCGGKESQSSADGKDYASRPVQFEFSYYKGGYGSEYLKAVTEDYMDNVAPDVYIKLRASSSNITTKANISSGVGASDLHQIEYGMFDMASSLEDISDVYEMQVYGEKVKVKDKVNPEMLDFYNENGKYYQFDFNKKSGWNWVYNDSVLKAALGENYVLPKTTDEFFKMGDELYNKGVYLTAGALRDTQGGEYLQYVFSGWFAQMLGAETNEKYFNGYTKNAGGEWVFCKDNPQMITDNKSSIEAVYAVAEKLLKRQASGQYLHKESASFEYKDLDKVFYGGKFNRQTVARFAFAYIGEWLEREVSEFFEDGSLKEKDQGIKAMKLPVISAIISRTPTINDDATLSKVVDFVDGNAAALPDGVSEADAEIVREARNMVVKNICNQLVIPKSAKNKDAIKQFIAYLCSDRAQKIAAKAASGTAMLPYGYVPADEDMGFTISDYIRSVAAVSDVNAMVSVDSAHLNSALVRISYLTWYYDKKNPSRTIAKDIYGGSYTPVSEIYDSTYENFNRSWANFIRSYEEKTK